MKSYSEYIQLIKEGLIRTHNILNHYDALKNNLDFIGFDFTLNIINKFRYELIIHNPKHFNKDVDIKNLFFSYNENMGYYPIKFDVIRSNDSIMKNIKMFSKQKVNNNIIEINNFNIEIKKQVKEIKFLFDAKYEDSLYSNDNEIPKKVYHLSPIKNRNKILKNGLYPKSNSRKVNHNERIYIFTNISKSQTLLDSLKINDIMFSELRKKQLYDLYEIALNNDVILHSDPDSINLSGYFLYESISTKNIKLIKTNL